MAIELNILDGTARMRIFDRFDSSCYLDFKGVSEKLMINQTVRDIEVDVSSLKYMDSAALGMLLLLDEKAFKAKKSVTLISVPGPVSEILKVANADKLFAIKLPNGVKLELRK